MVISLTKLEKSALVQGKIKIPFLKGCHRRNTKLTPESMKSVETDDNICRFATSTYMHIIIYAETVMHVTLLRYSHAYIYSSYRISDDARKS